MSETTGVKHTRKYAVYGDVYCLEDIWMPEEFYIGTFYRCKVFIAQNEDFHDHPEVRGDWSISWAEDYLYGKMDGDNDKVNDPVFEEQEADLKKKNKAFEDKYGIFGDK